MQIFRKPPDDLRTALAQCFWVGINGMTTADSLTREIFRTFQPGGFILFQRNVESLEQVTELNASLQSESSIPLFIAIDQEGGSVERLHELIGSIPPAMSLVASDSRRLTRQLSYSHAIILRHLGFNVNFTPVLDLALTDADNGLGTRCFSDQPRLVVEYARAIIEAHHKAGVLTSGKHFPGLGDTNLDSHIDLPLVHRSWKQLQKEDLVPYKKLLNQLPFIMINHALYPDQNSKMPASLAPEITSKFLLRKWNYNGVAISDDLNMGAVANLYNLPEAAEHALRAGNHMFLICKPEGVAKAYKRLLSRANRDEKLAAMIFHNATRIFAQKFCLAPMPQRTSIQREIRKLAKLSEIVSHRAITLLKDGPPAESEHTIFLPRTKWLKNNPTVKGKLYDIQITPVEAEKLARSSETQSNIVVVTNMNRNPGQQKLIEALMQLNKDVFIVQGHYPHGGIPERVRRAVSSYWTSPSAVKAATEVLRGQRKAKGRLPLRSKV